MRAGGKLVRDRIPEIIRRNGEEPVSYVADASEYRQRLRDKLSEETDEFLQADGEVAKEELADVLEVVQSACAQSRHDSGRSGTPSREQGRRAGWFREPHHLDEQGGR